MAQQGPSVQATALTVVRSQHSRIVFTDAIQRVAVGDPEIAGAELVTNREVLILGREAGRTTVLFWFVTGAHREFLVTVQRDLSLLQGALASVHPAVKVESAPDRDALVLTGTVPTIEISQVAEGVVRSYLQATERRSGAVAPQVQGPVGAGGGQPATVGAPDATAAGAANAAGGGVQLPGTPPARADGSVINLLRLEKLPQLPEERIQDAIKGIGGARVTARRVTRGVVRNDAEDVLVLEGSVPNQVALVRVLSLASQVFTGRATGDRDLRVVADEGGALSTATGQAGGGAQGGGTSLSSGGLGGASGGGRGGAARLSNQIMRNLGRATVIEAAGGRILSFIEVADLPQVRVNVQIYEVNRSKLRDWQPNTAALLSNFDQSSLRPAASAGAVQSSPASVGVDQLQNVLSFLGGRLVDQLQFSVGHLAVDTALSLLEREGLARNISSPSLTVLSGEPAVFQVGGEVPVTEAFTPAFGGQQTATPGVFTTVSFIPFGVVLQVRPLVGEDDMITVDVVPEVVVPDAGLTQSIRQTTGTTVPTTAFETRSLRTSARLKDGDVLLIGGLSSRTAGADQSRVPGAGDVPGLGWLFKNETSSEDDLEVVLAVNPVILRQRPAELSMWAMPDMFELGQAVTQPETRP